MNLKKVGGGTQFRIPLFIDTTKKKAEQERKELLKEPEVTKFVNDPFVPNAEKQIKLDRYYEKKKNERIQKVTEKKRHNDNPKNTSGVPQQSALPYKTQPPNFGQTQGFAQQPSINVQVYNPGNVQQQQNNSQKHFKDVVDLLPFYAREPQTIRTDLIDVPRYAVVNKNIINLDGGPNADHSRISKIYEDIFPKKKGNLSFSNLKNRVRMTKFIRNALVEEGDYESKVLSAYSDKSLISHLKLLNLNPFNDKYITDNPYKTLPNGILVYSSCFPIKYDSSKNKTSCARNSTGMLVKIFELKVNQKTNLDNNIINTGDGSIAVLNFYKNYVEDLVTNNICPHYVRMHAYYKYENSDIDYVKLKDAKKGGGFKIPQFKTGGFQIGSFVGKTPKPIKKSAEDNYGPIKEIFSVKKPEDTLITGGVRNPSMSDTSLIILTEAPTYTYAEWNINEYKDINNVKVAIRTIPITLNDKINPSIKFQKLFCEKVNLSKKINNAKLLWYIKDVETIHGKYWVYSWMGVKFYIINYGYILMADVAYDGVDFKDIINTGIIIDNKTSLTELYTNYYMYMHNRIGTDVNDSEIEYVDKSGTIHTYSHGELIVLKTGNKYKYACVVDVPNGIVTTYKLLLSITLNATLSTSASDIYKLKTQDIKQTSDNGVKFTKENIIETYTFS